MLLLVEKTGFTCGVGYGELEWITKKYSRSMGSSRGPGGQVGNRRGGDLCCGGIGSNGPHSLELEVEGQVEVRCRLPNKLFWEKIDGPSRKGGTT